MLAIDSRLSIEDVRAAALGLTEEQARELLYDWRMWARPSQLQPAGDWSVWLIMSGRGSGKTRTGAEWVREFVMQHPHSYVALVAPTAADARDVMIEGESGLMSIFPPDEQPEYFPSKRRVQFRNGANAFVYSAERGERLRGPQHHAAWLDEVGIYEEPELLWSNLKFGLLLRVGYGNGDVRRILQVLHRCEGRPIEESG